MSRARATLDVAVRRSNAMTNHGFKPTFWRRCPKCNRRFGRVYVKGDTHFCIICLAGNVEPREREEIAAEIFPEGGYAILSPGEKPPWERL